MERNKTADEPRMRKHEPCPSQPRESRPEKAQPDGDLEGLSRPSGHPEIPHGPYQPRTWQPWRRLQPPGPQQACHQLTRTPLRPATARDDQEGPAQGMIRIPSALGPASRHRGVIALPQAPRNLPRATTADDAAHLGRKTRLRNGVLAAPSGLPCHRSLQPNHRGYNAPAPQCPDQKSRGTPHIPWPGAIPTAHSDEDEKGRTRSEETRPLVGSGV